MSEIFDGIRLHGIIWAFWFLVDLTRLGLLGTFNT